MVTPRYLIGGGEKLSFDVERPARGMGDKSHPYTFGDAKIRLAKPFRHVGNALGQLPTLACPNGDAALAFTLHPSYLAKTYYPLALMQELDLRHLGSRAVHIAPASAVGKHSPDAEQPAPLLYLAGNAEHLKEFSEQVSNWNPRDENVRNNFRQIETVELPGPDRLKAIPKMKGRTEIPLEVVLHADIEGSHSIATAFARYIRSIGLRVDIDRRRQVGGLLFLPMHAPRDKLKEITDFTFLRALRQMPRVKPLDPMIRGLSPGFSVTLSEEAAVAPELSAAIFDGGLPKNHGLDKWVTLHDAPGVGGPVANGQRHGLAVTSAFLFGPLSPGQPLATPYTNVDHWRVLGTDTANDDFELLSILNRMEDILTTRPYNFVNISLGPDTQMEDDDVNVWTSTLDALLANGETVATIACGNNGEMDGDLGLDRIQPPSDGVNVIAVGACDPAGAKWKRAPYSAVGPGRSPGYVKPDFLAFGGSHASPFLILSSVSPFSGGADMGTSFAAPLALRAGVGIRSQFSQQLWAPTIKALLVHQANPESNSKAEVGWGKLSHDLADLVLCNDNEAHVIYQRQMPTTGAVRLFLPVPEDLRGDVEIKATFCLYCDVDPEDAINYTRAGLDIQFRPDIAAIAPPYRKDGKLITPKLPKSDSFFQASDFYAPEHSLRTDAQKWETTISRTKTKRATSLNKPAFDVTYQFRSHGHSGGRKAQLKFALVLTLRNKYASDLYEKVLRMSGNRLQPLRPRSGVQVPIRIPRR